MLSNDEGKMRTALCGELRAEDEGKEVVLVGWTANRRNLGGLLFIDLRDRSGLCQVRVDDAAHCPDIRNEYLLQVRGKVVRKPVANKKLASGEIEVAASSIEVVSKSEQPPFIVADETDALTVRPAENSRVGWLPAQGLTRYTNEWQMDGVYEKLLDRARAILGL